MHAEEREARIEELGEEAHETLTEFVNLLKHACMHAKKVK